MNQTFIFQKSNRLVAGLFVIGFLQFASSCKTTDDPIAAKKDSIITDQVYKDVEYASMTSSLSVGRLGIQTTTIGNKTYFVGGTNYGANIYPRLFKVIDVFDGSTLSWSTESLPTSYIQGGYVAAGSKVYFNGAPDLNSTTTASNKINTYDLISKAEITYEMGVARFVKKVVTDGKKAILIGGRAKVGDYTNVTDASYAVDVIDLNTTNKVSTRVPENVIIDDAAAVNGKVYVVAGASMKVFVYDIAANLWSTLAINTPAERIQIADGKLILFTNSSSSFQVYDLASAMQNNYTLSTARIQPEVIAAGNKVFFAGGVEFAKGFYYSTDVIDIFDTRTKAFASKKLSLKRFGFGAAVNGKFVLFAGGYDLNNPPYVALKSVDFFILNK